MGNDPTPLCVSKVFLELNNRGGVCDNTDKDNSPLTGGREGQMRSESGGRAVVVGPSALLSKDLPAGLSKVPPRESARRYIRRRVSVDGMWRRRNRGEILDMTISRVPRAWLPETNSGRQKGFRHFP